MVTISIEDPGRSDVVALLGQSDFYSASMYPPESRHQPDLAALSATNVRFFTARLGGWAVGCGALLISGAGPAELKRFFVDPAARGQGIGQAILLKIEAAARREGIQLLQLETG